jgi:hypothetical protein
MNTYTVLHEVPCHEDIGGVEIVHIFFTLTVDGCE